MPDEVKTSMIKKVGDGILAWIGPAIVLGLLWMGNFLVSLKQDVSVIKDVKVTVDKIEEDSSALWGTSAEQNAKIQRLEATVKILEKLVIRPAHRIGIIDEMPEDVPDMGVDDVDEYMIEQRVKYPAQKK